MNEKWVISGKRDGSIPSVGGFYGIKDVRKGDFVGRILEVNGDFATVKVLKGKPVFISIDHKFGYNGLVSIRASLCLLIPIRNPTEFEAKVLKRISKPDAYRILAGNKMVAISAACRRLEKLGYAAKPGTHWYVTEMGEEYLSSLQGK